MDNTTLVAIIILVGIFGLMAIVLLKWGVDAALKIWGVLGVVLGAIVSFYFTDRVKETEVAQVSEKAADELGQLKAEKQAYDEELQKALDALKSQSVPQATVLLQQNLAKRATLDRNLDQAIGRLKLQATTRPPAAEPLRKHD